MGLSLIRYGIRFFYQIDVEMGLRVSNGHDGADSFDDVAIFANNFAHVWLRNGNGQVG